jgi:hypothetical protein
MRWRLIKVSPLRQLNMGDAISLAISQVDGASLAQYAIGPHRDDGVELALLIAAGGDDFLTLEHVRGELAALRLRTEDQALIGILVNVQDRFVLLAPLGDVAQGRVVGLSLPIFVLVDLNELEGLLVHHIAVTLATSTDDSVLATKR